MIKPIDLSIRPLDAVERIKQDILSKRTIEGKYKEVTELYSPSKVTKEDQQVHVGIKGSLRSRAGGDGF